MNKETYEALKMTKKEKQESRGWWELKISGVERLEDSERNHIAHQIQEGYWEGEIIQEED